MLAVSTSNSNNTENYDIDNNKDISTSKTDQNTVASEITQTDKNYVAATNTTSLAQEQKFGADLMKNKLDQMLDQKSTTGEGGYKTVEGNNSNSASETDKQKISDKPKMTDLLSPEANNAIKTPLNNKNAKPTFNKQPDTKIIDFLSPAAKKAIQQPLPYLESNTASSSNNISSNEEPKVSSNGLINSGVGTHSIQDIYKKPGSNPYIPANSKVTPEIAAQILENVTKGQPPWRPELGQIGKVAWFVSEGNPYTSTTAAKSTALEVEITKGAKPLIFGEKEMIQIFESELPAAKVKAEAEYRSRNNIGSDTPLSRTAMKSIDRFAAGLAERNMWTRIGEMVGKSPDGVGEVIFTNSKFSKQGDGKFVVVSDANKIKIKGGVPALLETLEKQGVKAEPVVEKAAQALAEKMHLTGEVRAAFRVGGRILFVVGAANDAYQIYYAKDKLKAVVETAGGWAGATIASTTFAELFTPVDAAGPLAWAAHGVGTLIAGGVGYWIGSSTTRTVYELIPDEGN